MNGHTRTEEQNLGRRAQNGFVASSLLMREIMSGKETLLARFHTHMFPHCRQSNGK